MSRINKDKYYLDIAEVVLTRSTCMNKHWGAVLVKDDIILSTGFNGAPRGILDCTEKDYCILSNYRKDNNLGRGTAYERCIGVHAEMNAIVFSNVSYTKNSTLYLVGKEYDVNGMLKYVDNPNVCSICKKLIINAGISKVIIKVSPTNWIIQNPSIWEEQDIIGGY